MGGASTLPPLILKLFQLKHLNQAGVQDLICDLTDTHASTLWHWNGTKVAQMKIYLNLELCK